MMSKPIPAQPRQRLIGTITVVALTLVLAGVLVLRARHHDAEAIDAGLVALTQAVEAPAGQRRAHLDRARATFARAAGTYALDPQALIGLSLIEPLAQHAGETATALAAEDTPEAQIEAQARALLARGKTSEAVAFLERSAQAGHRSGRGLAALEQFARRWQAVRRSWSAAAAGGG